MGDTRNQAKKQMCQKTEMTHLVEEQRKDTASLVQGRIVKGIAGFYYVATKEYGELECHAKGVLRKQQKKPLVGDWVLCELVEQEKGIGSIHQILPRTNQLIRPEVANVDQALVVFAYHSPEPNLLLLNKFLIMMSKKGVPCLLCFNKEDLARHGLEPDYLSIYQDSGVKLYSLQANGQQADTLLEELRAQLHGKLTVLAGPSGVGKSTLVNLLCPEAEMETGEISRKLERGKHTTRHSQLFPLWESSYLMDTPGFTAFDLDMEFTKEELKDYFPEFYAYEGRCRYQECSHTHEPSCAVKEAVEHGKIARVRYEGYKGIYEELKNRRRY